MDAKKKKIIIYSVWSAAVAVVLALTIFANCYAVSWDRALSGYFGEIGGSGNAVVSADLTKQEKDCVAEVVDEGTVLLQNDNNALPLKSGNKVSVFGITNQMWMTKERVSSKNTVFLESLQAAGLTVNNELRKFYKQSTHTDWGNGSNLGDGAIKGDWRVDEVPQIEYNDTVKASYKNFSDAAIVVFSRGGGEGGDLPRNMGLHGGSDSESYLELTKDEKDLLQAVKNEPSFKKRIVILHSCNAMQMDFMLADYNIDAVLWVSGTGANGVEEMGKLLVEGGVNPSGHNVDTYVYDNFSSPAMQNFGDYRFTDGGEIMAVTTTNTKGSYSYMNYGEGVYVGYKYYETRYADKVASAENVGSYDYNATVYRPFGYGLSYSDFTWSEFNATEPDASGNMTLSVKVTNTSDTAGKEVVGFYYRAPYTAGGTEKSAVNLIEFGKTKLLGKNESETVTVTVNVEDMASYDMKTEQAYVLDAGKYAVTAASDAHRAVNNFLALDGYTTANGMTENGNTAFAKEFTLEKKVYKTAKTGSEIKNLFDDAKLGDATYLSRANWSALDDFDKSTGLGGIAYATSTKEIGSDSSKAIHSATMDSKGTVRVAEASEKIKTGLKAVGWEASGIEKGIGDSSWKEVSYNSKSTSYMLADMKDVPYGDPKWDDIVNQMSQAEQINIVGLAGWGTAEVKSVGKPEAKYMDGPQGMINYVDPNNPGYQFTNQNMIGATWNKELAAKVGDLISKEFIEKGASVWWAPGINIHRAAFSGRNFEYYSEDPIHSAYLGLYEMRAAQANGVVTELKHFFLNDQEMNRNSNGKVAVFAEEQAMREIYAKPFQICVEDGGSFGIMASMNRIGTTPVAMSYPVLTGLLRNEWGFEGIVMTDSQTFDKTEAEQGLAAGCDMVLTTRATEYASSTLESKGGKYMLHNAAKNILYMTANSAAMQIGNTGGFPVYALLLMLLDLLVLVYLAYGTVEILVKLHPEQTILSKKGKWIMRGVLWGVAAVFLVTVAVMFFTTWLPVLRDALQNY